MKKVHAALAKVRRPEIRRELANAIQNEMLSVATIGHETLYTRIQELHRSNVALLVHIAKQRQIMNEQQERIVELEARLLENESEAA